MSFKGISYLELWQSVCPIEGELFVQFGRVNQEEQFCEIILNLNQWFRRRCRLNTFLIWSSGGSLFGGAELFVQFS